MINKNKIVGLIDERISELNNGLFVVSLTISKQNIINVELDKFEGNVSVTDCVSVSRNIEHNLNREEQDFELSVSSAGLDNGLRVFPQYKKNIGKGVKVMLIDGGTIEGTMINATPEQITVQTKCKERIEGRKKKETIIEDHVLPMDKIKETKIVISFK
jgi:ribosome maturation factor RimP